MVTIYTVKGTKRFETPINIGSKRAYKLMGDDYITLVFSVKNPLKFALGDYCDIQDMGRFELCEPYKPTYNSNTGGYDYELKLDAQYIKWRNKIMRYLPRIGSNETSFALTATAEVHMEMILANVNALATERLSDGTEQSHPNYLHNGQREWVVSIDEGVDASAKSLSYDSINIIDALTQIAEAYDCEWWINGNIICLGKCEETNDYVDLELGVNVAEMSHSDSKEDLATRILVFGGEHNISPRYRKDLIFNVTEISSNGNRISDGARVLQSEWFAEDLRVSAPGASFALAFTSSKSATVSSSSTTDALIHSHTLTQTNIEAGEWKIALSKYKPTVTFNNRKGSCSEWVCKVSIMGTTQEGATKILAEYASTMYIYALTAPIQASFQDQTLKIESNLKSISVTVYFYAKLQGNSSIEASVSPGNGVSMNFTKSDPRYKVGGLTIDKIDTSGKVIATYANATFNPDYADGYSEKNVIQLPYGSSMAVGDRFKIREVIESKVKSSYFSSRYSAYEDMGSIITNGVVTNRLMLPVSYGKPYVDYKEGLSMEEGVEDVVVFEDIYPKATCMITSVSTVDRKETVENDDGSQTDRTFTAFKIKDDFFTAARPFDNDYIIPNKTLEITFGDGKRYKEGDAIPSGKKVGELIYPNSGKLNGWKFEVKFTKDEDGSAIWEIVRDNESYIPNDILRPEVGDTFVLTGCDIAVVDDLYTDEAEKELLETALRYVAKINIDPSTYDCTMMPDVMKNGLTLGIGKRVNLLNPAYFDHEADADGKIWGRKSRVIGYEYPLDIPWDNPVYTIGEKSAYSRFGEIEDKIDALKIAMGSQMNVRGGSVYSNGQSTNVAGGAVYVIGQNDSTAPSETNVFSALRSMMEFCSKKASEVINYLWKFTQGIEIGNYIENNDGAKIDNHGDAEFNSVKTRQDVNVGGSVSVENDLTVRKSITIGDGFVPGAYGGGIWTDEDGRVHIETDFIEARVKLQAKEIEIQEETHVGGVQINSPAAMRCKRVIPIYNDANSIVAYKCCFTAEDDEGNQIDNQFKVGDLAKCETFNLVRQANGMMGNHYFWRKVIEVGFIEKGDSDYNEEYGKEGYIVVSNLPKEKDSASDAPLAGDRIITVGNDTDKERQNVIITASYGSGSPYIYQFSGINTFALTKDNLKIAISPNGNIFTGKFIIENQGTEVDVVDYIENNIYLEAFQLALSNEMAAVYCDKDGNPVGELPSSRLTVYKGKTVEIGWSFSCECVGCKAAIVGNVVYLSELTDKNATVTITATKSQCPTLTKVMTITKLTDGETGLQGEHAVEFAIEPETPMVLVDMEGNCDPSTLKCKVYMVIGNKLRVEIPTSNNAPITTYAAGEKLLFFNGRLFVDRPVEVDVPTDLTLRYVVVKQKVTAKEEEDGSVSSSATTTTETERIYTNGIITKPEMKQIIFKLYKGDTLVDMQTVIVQVDSTAMQVVYKTKFDITDRKIEFEASRISKNETDIANLTITADKIQSQVSNTSGIVQDFINGAGRNLLLKTNQYGTNFGYTTDSVYGANFQSCLNHPGCVICNIPKRNDATWEVFYYDLRPELIKRGEKYTLSFRISNTSQEFNAIEFFAMIADTTARNPLTNSVHFSTIVARGEQYLTVTLDAIETGTTDGNQKVYIAVVGNDVNKWTQLHFWNFKLEKGATATAYSEAPEDREDYLYDSLQSQITQTAKEIRIEVTEKIGESEQRITEAYTSLISATAKQVQILASRFNADGSLANTAGLVTTATANKLYAFDAEGNLVSFIEQTASTIKIKATHISLEGLVTMNGNFKVLEDGSIEAVNGKFTGEINASKGTIGGFIISSGNIGAAKWTYDANGNMVIGQDNYGLSLWDDMICFNHRDGRQAILGTWSNFDQPMLMRLINNKSEQYDLSPKIGIYFDISNQTFGENYAFLGKGNGFLNGIIEGYAFHKFTLESKASERKEMWYSGNFDLTKANKFLVTSTGSSVYAVLPSLKSVHQALGIGDTADFAVTMIIQCDLGSQNFYVSGRDDVEFTKDDGTKVKTYNTNEYPLLTHWNGGYQSPHEMGAGDMLEILLVYDNSRTTSQNISNYDTKYTARIINKIS